ncbi:MAG TPA: hypothetical protein VMF56_03355 [Acidobacteriaceae bacterium]|nr:hypothetical protein [Acidobacteriaceae bacterium]
MMRREFTGRSIAGVLLVVLFVFGCVNTAIADGGRLRFRRAAGPFIVTLFTTPDPLTAGRADFSVAVERAGMPGLVQDAHIDLILTPADGDGGQIVLHASHKEATSKWLQAANFSLPARGIWHVQVVVRRGQEVGECFGEVRVRAPGTRDLMWDILPVPLGALLFVLHQNLKQKYNRKRRNRLASFDS